MRSSPHLAALLALSKEIQSQKLWGNPHQGSATAGKYQFKHLNLARANALKELRFDLSALNDSEVTLPSFFSTPISETIELYLTI